MDETETPITAHLSNINNGNGTNVDFDAIHIWLYEQLTCRLNRAVNPRLPQTVEDAANSAVGDFRKAVDAIEAGNPVCVADDRNELLQLMLTIARRKISRYARREMKDGVWRQTADANAHDPTNTATASAQSREPDPGEEAGLLEGLAAVEKAIGDLKPEHQTVLELWLKGWKQKDIAAHVKKNPKTVRRWLKVMIPGTLRKSFGLPFRRPGTNNG